MADPIVVAPLAVNAQSTVEETRPLVDAPAPSPSAALQRRRSATSVWLWGGVALAAAVLVSGAVVIGASAGGTTTIHDGTLGTLRR
jgi:hypothetical protein